MKNDELFKKVARIKTKNGILLFFILHRQGAMRESDLLNFFKMGAHSLRAVLASLVNLGYAKFVMDKNNVTYYMMDKHFYEKGDSLYKKIEVSEANVRFLNICELASHAKSTDSKMVEEISKLIESLYVKTFKGVKYPYADKITKKFVQEMLLLFRKLVKSTVYDDVLKSYLMAAFKRMSESAGFNMRRLSDVDRIIKFVNNRPETNPGKLLTCRRHDLNCAYWDKEGCRLEKDGIKCSKNIRKHMKNKYGRKI